ncbi:hypothetical protein F1D05_09945 [Kribbella qitaiheensis]|uniref:Uncharacterized protein n=1 Tax=Kribbella qitaiheensis TaxID=1544730 RepID=A0A7G6WVY9_9ACTN|nr:hypothetical protein [Kribbella qitaiheensis]QNE18154.1 hypothetical protein F1D05_09945 [Kribbella qitaiheensis]
MSEPLLTKTWRFLRRGQVLRAAQGFRAAWATHAMVDELGPRTTCSEAISLADLLCALGEPEFAGLLLTAHAVEDAQVPDRLAHHHHDSRIDQAQIEARLAHWREWDEVNQPIPADHDLDITVHTASWDEIAHADRTA